MGAYAGYQGKTRIAEGDQTAFSRQMVKILNYGGMMSFDVVYALDHEIGLLRPVKLYPGRKTVFYYNYFEDESWELAEFDSKSCSLWTEKVGSGEFADVVLAAYMLYCIYDDFKGTVGYTGSIDEEWICGWIKHLIGDELPASCQEKLRDIEPIYTEDFLYEEDYIHKPLPPEVQDNPPYELSDDDRLYWWDGTDEVLISEEIEEWLLELADRHKQIKKENAAKWSEEEYSEETFFEVFVDADETYGRIDPFETMFHEFMDNREELDYRAALELFRQLLDENREKGKVIKLITGRWELASRKLTHNPTRMKIKRYLAVMANRKLRKKYFGF